MIDLKAARADPDRVRPGIARKGGTEAFDELLRADERWRELVPQVDELRGRQKLKGKPTPEQLEELARVKEELRALEDKLTIAEAERDAWLAQVPNPPDPTAPDGVTDEDAEEIRRWGDPAPEGPEHTEVGRFDMERAARLSGSRFGSHVTCLPVYAAIRPMIASSVLFDMYSPLLIGLPLRIDAKNSSCSTW